MNTTAAPIESSSTSPDCYALRNWAAEFGPQHADPEGLHTDFVGRPDAHYALTATQYFGFHVPKENVHALLMLWHHPNMGMISGGPMVWQGIKKTQLACELLDYRNYMSDKALGDFKSYKLDNGYAVEVIDGGKSFHQSYSDPSRQNMYDIVQTPVTERIYWPSGNHFEQVMRTKGELVLRGKRLVVDGFHVRDRSWGENRMETPFAVPPFAWSTGVFDEGFSFNVTGCDDPTLDPVWAGRYSVAPKDTLKFGWVIADGIPAPIAALSKLTSFDANMFPTAVAMRLVDTRGRSFDLKGAITALSPYLPWPNATAHVCLTRWECNGKTGWGDHQEVHYTDFLQGQNVK